MHLNLDVHHQYVLDRQQRLRAEAAAHRLTDRTPVRTYLSRLVCRFAIRFDAPVACGRARRDTAAEHI